jgi:hypothetical protein
MADDTDPLNMGGQAESEEEPEPKEPSPPEGEKSAPDLPGTSVPRAEGVKDPTGKYYPTSAGYEAMREEILKEAQDQTKAVRDATEPYRKQIIEELKQPKPELSLKPYPVIPEEQEALRALQGSGQRVFNTSVPMLVLGGLYNRAAFASQAGGVASTMRPKGMSDWRWGRLQNQFKAWDEVTKQIDKYNQAQIETQKRILDNRNLDIEDKMKIINMISQEYQDPKQAKNSKGNDLPGVITELHNQEKAQEARRNATAKYKQDWQKWFIKRNSDYVGMLKQHGIDLTDPDPEAFSKAFAEAGKKYPIDQYLAEKSTKAQDPDTSGKAAPKYHPGEEQKNNDPLNMRKGPATDEEKKKFSDEMNSYEMVP